MRKPVNSMDGMVPGAKRRRLDDFGSRDLAKRKEIKQQVARNLENPKHIQHAKRQVRHNLDETPSIQPEKKKRSNFLKRNKKNTETITSNKRRWLGLRAAKRSKEEKKSAKANRPRHRKYIKRTLITILILGLLTGGLIALKGWTALSNIIDRSGAGSPLLGDIVLPSELSGEGDGRINIMLLGIGGEGHQAGLLADTILVASIDPTANEASLLSIPRDLQVTIPGHGKRKINEANYWGEQDAGPNVENGGARLMQETLETILGIPIHYYVKADFEGFKKAVDIVGGVDITLESRVYDPIFNREYGYGALDIGPGLVHLDGQTALLLGRARGSTGGVGLSRSDFDRNPHQRLLLIALKDKVLSAGTLTNPVKIYEIIGALGDHARTDLELSEMLGLRDIAERIPTESIVSYGLDDSSDNFLVKVSGTEYFVPRAGNFSEIQNFVRSIFVDGFIISEEAEIDVLNGTTQEGLAGLKANELESFGYFLGEIGNSPVAFETTRVYDLTADSPFTKRYLEQRFGVVANTSAVLPSAVITDADFVIILGNDAIEETAESG